MPTDGVYGQDTGMEQPVSQLWKNPLKRRYYRVQVAPDLFGELCLVRSWGSLDTARGNCKMERLHDWQEAKRRVARVGKERVRRGYQKIDG